MFTDDTISAISTPLGRGGIGIVRLSGPLSLSIAKKIFTNHNSNKVTFSTSHRVYSGKIIDPSTKKAVDEALVTVMKAPHSYTREDVIEISCHGGSAVLSKVLDITLKEGARLATPGEFTKRAFLNGRLDLAQAEAVIDLINAKSEKSLFNTVSQLNGSVSNEVNRFREILIDISSKLELTLDFSEEDVPSVSLIEIKKTLSDLKECMGTLVESYNCGRLLREGPRIVIAGRTNVGKSSLFNLLVKKERSIVTRHSGTTRDFIEEELLFDGAIYKIFDTAGIRTSDHEIESEGIARSCELIDNADVILLVIDASAGLTDEDVSLMNTVKSKECIYLLNKIDLKQRTDVTQIAETFGQSPDNVLKISAKKNRGINELKSRIKQIITTNVNVSDNEKTIISSLRHKELLARSLESIESALKACEKSASEEFIADNVTRALNYLNEITGHSFSEEVLEKIFNEFCIGK